MKRPTIDSVRAALPALDELRPVLDQLIADSAPDDGRAWAGSGALASVDDRLVDGDALAAATDTLAEREAAHTSAVYATVSEAVTALGVGDEAAAARGFLHVFALEEKRDRFDAAEKWADAAVRAAERASDQELRSLALRRRGRARRACARYRDGERDYERAFEISDAIGDVQGSAEAAIGTGNLLEDEGRWDDAEQWYRRALAILDDMAELTSERWHALLNLHVVQRAQGEVEESVTALREAEAVATEIGASEAAMFLENAWGQWHLARGEHMEAIDRLRTALDRAEGTRARVTIRLNLAQGFLQSSRTLDSVEEARRAEQAAIVGTAFGQLPEVYRLLGRAAATEGNPDAFVLFERALALIDARGLPRIERARTLEVYALAEEQKGEVESATALRREATELYAQLGIRPARTR